MIRILIAEDHTIIRQGLCALMAKTDDLDVVAECGNGVDALALIVSLNPDVAILDISMPLMDGLTLVGRLQKIKTDCKIILLTALEDPVLYEQATNLCVQGYFRKDTDYRELFSAIRAVAAGVMGRPPAHYNDVQSSSASYLLTGREREILALIANGLTNRVIADVLSISVNTVNRHRANMMIKLGFHSTAELVRYAFRTGLTPPC